MLFVRPCHWLMLCVCTMRVQHCVRLRPLLCVLALLATIAATATASTAPAAHITATAGAAELAPDATASDRAARAACTVHASGGVEWVYVCVCALGGGRGSECGRMYAWRCVSFGGYGAPRVLCVGRHIGRLLRVLWVRSGWAGWPRGVALVRHVLTTAAAVASAWSGPRRTTAAACAAFAARFSAATASASVGAATRPAAASAAIAASASATSATIAAAAVTSTTSVIPNTPVR